MDRTTARRHLATAQHFVDEAHDHPDSSDIHLRTARRELREAATFTTGTRDEAFAPTTLAGKNLSTTWLIVCIVIDHGSTVDDLTCAILTEQIRHIDALLAI